MHRSQSTIPLVNGSKNFTSSLPEWQLEQRGPCFGCCAVPFFAEVGMRLPTGEYAPGAFRESFAREVGGSHVLE